jgi:hypothetical protein
MVYEIIVMGTLRTYEYLSKLVVVVVLSFRQYKRITYYTIQSFGAWEGLILILVPVL